MKTHVAENGVAGEAGRRAPDAGLWALTPSSVISHDCQSGVSEKMLKVRAHILMGARSSDRTFAIMK